MIFFKTGKSVCRNRFIYPLILAVFWIAFTTSPALAELTLESVYPNQGVLGEDLSVTLKGTGFDENTRVSMTLDVGNKKAIIGSVDAPGHALDVAVVDDIAYVAYDGLKVIDISNPQNPNIIGSIYTPGGAKGVTVVGDTAYVVAKKSGLHVIDISSPASPQIIGTVDTPVYALDVTVVGNIAYVADGGSGLQVIDISNPAAPQIIGSVNTPGVAYGVSVVGNTAYVADWGSGLQVIDISNPASPQIIGSVDTPSYAYDVTVKNDTAYVADQYSGLQVIDISNPASPQIIGSVNTPGDTEGVIVVGDTAYVADQYSGLQVIDISSPASPQIIGSVNTPGSACGVTVVGDTAYVADSSSGFQVIDISSPAESQIIGFVDMPGYAWGVSVTGDTAYVAGGSSGLQVIDISYPAAPQIIGSVDTLLSDDFRGVTVVGNIAYVADIGLQVIDISNPANPQIIGYVATPGYDRVVTVVGSTAYTSSSSSGLQVIDISNPASPQIIGSVYTPGAACGVTVVGDTAYVADGWKDLQVIDISSPATPQIIGSVDIPGYVSGVTAVDNTAYVAASSSSGLQVIDISNPASPQIIGSVDKYGDTDGVTVVGSTAYVADHGGGLQVIDISNPASPQIIGFVDTPGNSEGVTVVGDTAYVADGDSGLVIVPLPVKIKPVIVNNETSISVTLPSPEKAGNYTLRVFNSEESSELAGAVNFSTLDLAGIDPNGLVIQTLEGKAVPVTLDQDQDLYLQLIYVDPEGTPFNLSNLPGFKVEWLSSHPQALGINPLGHLVAKGPGTAKITAQITSGKKSVHITVPGELVPENSGNLIIVSGRKYKEEALSEYFTGMANSVYDMFLNRGFDHDDIYYFCPYGQQSLPGESADIVDRVINFSESSLSTEIMESIMTWAAGKENSGPLYIYLVDHGTSGQPIMPVTPSSPVNAAQIGSALDHFEQATSRKVVVVIEACYSGKWLNALKGDNRVVIASTGSYHAQNLPTDNLISFSHYFFNDLAKGKSLGAAFDYANDKTKGISYAANQTPQFIATMDLSSFYLVGDFASKGTLPLFVSYTGKEAPIVIQKDSFAALEAGLNMPYADGFEVWASITPPVPEKQGPGEQESGETPYVVPSMIELDYTGVSDPDAYFGGDKLYSGQSEVFDIPGVYDLVYFAKNISSQIIHSEHVAVFVQENDTPIIDYTFEMKAAGLESLPSELETDQHLDLTLEAPGLNDPVSIQWFSSNPGVVTVDATGHVTAKAAGQAKITAIYPGGSLSHYVTVSGVPGTKSVGNLILIGGISEEEINKDSKYSLYDCFKTIAKQVYKTFHNRGFSHEDIFYFSPYGKETLPGESKNIVDQPFSIDESGMSDKILAKITTWASNQDNTGPLYLYLIGHGEPGKLIVNTVTDLLASDVDIALDTFQETGRPVVVLVEACHSGTWIEPLKSDNRLIITSTNDKKEDLTKDGVHSFSYHLATELSKGITFESAFGNASNTIIKWVQTQEFSDQAPQSYKGIASVWTNSLVGNFASAGASFFKSHTGKDGPFQLQTGSVLNLEATLDIMNPQDVSVFAVVTPPVPGIPETLGDSETPVLETFVVDLTLEPTAGDDKVYSAASPVLTSPGTYRVTFCIKDSLGEIHTADPVLFFVETSQEQVALAVNQGWNLLSARIAFSVTEKLSDDTKFSSVWKWENIGWAVYLPGGGTQAYADSKGFGVLSTINPGEGFWVNSVGSETLSIAGTATTGSLTLTSGWNLVGLKSDQARTIADFISGNETKIASVWKWQNGGWAVYLSAEDDGGDAYAESKGFTMLSDIEPGEGFWVNCTENITLH
jgi:hypothetical protein